MKRIPKLVWAGILLCTVTVICMDAALYAAGVPIPIRRIAMQMFGWFPVW